MHCNLCKYFQLIFSEFVNSIQDNKVFIHHLNPLCTDCYSNSKLEKNLHFLIIRIYNVPLPGEHVIIKLLHKNILNKMFEFDSRLYCASSEWNINKFNKRNPSVSYKWKLETTSLWIMLQIFNELKCCGSLYFN